ncbi:MAG: hypothetical protein AAFP02_04265 [Bacteroidota bacterium]
MKELIRKHFDGQLSDAEWASFQSRYHEPAFQEVYLQEKAIWETQLAAEHQRLGEELDFLDWEIDTQKEKRQLNEMMLEEGMKQQTSATNGHRTKTKTSRFAERPVRPLYWGAGIAAGLAILLLIYFLPPAYPSLDAQFAVEPYANYAQPLTASIDTIDPAFRAYENGDYEEASQFFAQYPDLRDRDDLLLYQAISMMMLEQWTPAISNLQRLSQNETPTQYESIAPWYLALAYYHSQQTERCRKQLQFIIDRGLYRAENAQQLYPKL